MKPRKISSWGFLGLFSNPAADEFPEIGRQHKDNKEERKSRSFVRRRLPYLNSVVNMCSFQKKSKEDFPFFGSVRGRRQPRQARLSAIGENRIR
jgi:hypothetical protein